MKIAESYDKLAAAYHLIFEDWEASIERQADALNALLLDYGVEPTRSQILDCACGIGTQSIGLAKLGFRVVGCDISAQAISRARVEASQRKLVIEFNAADMLDLSTLGDRLFDAVICMDNALPHLDNEQELIRAAGQVRAKLNPGGVFLASIRDYDALLEQRPVVHGPCFYSDEGNRRIVFQLWDWLDDRRYIFHLYITWQSGEHWNTCHSAATYRAVRRHELGTALTKAGFSSVHWMFPSDTGFYQPIVVCTNPSADS